MTGSNEQMRLLEQCSGENFQSGGAPSAADSGKKSVMIVRDVCDRFVSVYNRFLKMNLDRVWPGKVFPSPGEIAEALYDKHKLEPFPASAPEFEKNARVLEEVFFKLGAGSGWYDKYLKDTELDKMLFPQMAWATASNDYVCYHHKDLTHRFNSTLKKYGCDNAVAPRFFGESREKTNGCRFRLTDEECSNLQTVYGVDHGVYTKNCMSKNTLVDTEYKTRGYFQGVGEAKLGNAKLASL